MARQGYRRIVLNTVDTDAVTLAISLFNEIGDGLDELWIDFGVGRNRRFYPVHSLYHQLGQDKAKAKALRFFHSFTGCDQVSFMLQRHQLLSYGKYSPCYAALYCIG